MKTKSISERYWNSDQSWYFERVVQIDSHKLKVEIRRNAYDVQSYARVKRWNGEEWKLVNAMPISECECKRISYIDRPATVSVLSFAADTKRLLDEAVKIIS